MSLRALMLIGLLMSATGQVVLMADLVAERVWLDSTALWIFLHLVTSVAAALCGGRLLGITDLVSPMLLFLFALTVLIPVAGCLGAVAALSYGVIQARLHRHEPDYWTITPRASLPFTTPSGRELTPLDSRGFTEHLMYSRNDEDLYRKVLAAGNIRTSLAVSALKQAMRHTDERIRLTAFKTLDRKVTELNRQIQQLEAQVAQADDGQCSNSWLQIASNYWELLTLEKGEPVARQQLLEKASTAAIQAVAVLPINRNAHFILGRVSLLQGDTRRATIAFERAQALGMPADKVLPYLAEVAFKRHDFQRVRNTLSQLDPAIRAYPPLQYVAEYWT